MFERCEPAFNESASEADPSSSVSGFGRFFDGAGLALLLNVVCDNFLGAALGAVAFFTVGLEAAATIDLPFALG